MPEFTQSWTFWFLVVVISFAAGFILAIILAGSSRASRIEEKIEDSIKFETATQGKPEDA